MHVHLYTSFVRPCKPCCSSLYASLGCWIKSSERQSVKRSGSKCTRRFSVESSGLKGLDEGLQEAVDLVDDFDLQLKREPSTEAKPKKHLDGRFKHQWPTLWRMLCEYLANSGFLVLQGRPPEYPELKKAILAFSRSQNHVLACIPEVELQQLAKTKNVMPTDRKVRNAVKRIRLTYSKECDKEHGVPEASFQDVMRLLLATQFLSLDPERSGQKSVKDLLSRSERILSYILEAVLTPDMNSSSKQA